jgi:hypothetical protein
MDKQAYALVKYLKVCRVYVLHSKIIAYVPSSIVKDILIQLDIDERRSKMEIKPTKLVKGQSLAKLLAESNCKYLEVSFINTFSENQQAKVFDRSLQDRPPLAECAWYKDIIYFLKMLRPLDGMGKIKERDVNLKAIRYFLIIQALYWKDPLGVIFRCLDP